MTKRKETKTKKTSVKDQETKPTNKPRKRRGTGCGGWFGITVPEEIISPTGGVGGINLPEEGDS